MNHWNIGHIPYSWAPKDIILEWSGMDHVDNYNKNPNKLDWENVNISYQYNPQGFRCPDLNNFLGQKVNLALGCSYTEGVGLPVASTWPSLVELQTDHPMLNLGLGGGATDSVARILTNVSSLFDIQTVYILWPPLYRFENYFVFDDTGKLITKAVYKFGKIVKPVAETYRIDTVLPMDANPEHVWALTDQMNEQRLYKNQLIVELLAQKFGYVVHQITNDTVMSTVRTTAQNTQLDFARDGVHWGTYTQKEVSKIMLDKN